MMGDDFTSSSYPENWILNLFRLNRCPDLDQSNLEFIRYFIKKKGHMNGIILKTTQTEGPIGIKSRILHKFKLVSQIMSKCLTKLVFHRRTLLPNNFLSDTYHG